MESIAVQTSGLTRRFGGVVAVSDLNLEVRRGEIFGLVGPDGAGKTTTLRLLCGLMNPTAGQISVAGFDVARDVEPIKDRIGYMAQRFGLYGDLSVDENMDFYADLFGISRAERDALLPKLLGMTRMEPFRKRGAAKLSGGMKQKLALMCTLLHRPEILFLDEPTTGVDPVSRRDFWAILYQLVKEGMTVIVTTAYLDEAERCNRVGLMHQGRLIRVDTPNALKRQLEFVCVEIQGRDLRNAAAAFRAMAGVVSVEPAGASLHLFFDPAGTDVATLRESAGRRGLAVTAREIEPSLEDVFIALVRRAGPAAEAAGEREEP
jgi:ABC-2 type transport system ATP-binding protein